MKKFLIIIAIICAVTVPLRSHADYQTAPPDSLWSVQTDMWIRTSPVAVGDSLICFTGTNGNVVALTPDGAVAWTVETHMTDLSAPVVGTDATIYVKNNVTLLALNPNGGEKWRYAYPAAQKAASQDAGKTSSWGREKAFPAPAIGADGTIYATFDGVLCAISEEGAFLWECAIGGYYELSTPAISPDATIYFTNSNNILYAIDPDGRLKWSFETWGYAMLPPIVDVRGCIYLCDSYNFTCVSPAGDELWRYSYGSFGFRYSTPVIDRDGTIFIVDAEENLHALDKDGVMQWRVPVGQRIRYSSPVIAEGGIIYLLDNEGFISAYDKSGTQLSRTESAPGQSASPLLADDGRLYIPCSRGAVYALQTASSGMEKYAVWPCEGRDNRRSGQLGLSTEYAYFGGIVKDSVSGEAIEGVVISAEAGLYSAVSDKNGRFLVLGIEPGSYTFSAECFGYLPVEMGTVEMKAGVFIEDEYSMVRDRKWIKWKMHLGGAVTGKPAIADDGTLYAGTSSALVALDPGGAELWRYESTVNGTPVLGSDGAIYFGSRDSLTVINGDGELLWSFNAGNYIQELSVARDGTVYFGSNGRLFYAVAPGGTTKWQLQSEGDEFSKPIIGNDGTIYFTAENLLYAVDPHGEVLWSHAGSRYTCHAPVVGSDGMVYHSDNAGKLFALNSDGSEKWARSDYDMDISPTIDSIGMLYCSGGSSVFSVSPNGSIRWRKDMEDKIAGSPAIGSNGIIYFGTEYFKQFAAITNEGYLTWRMDIDGSLAGSPAIDSDGAVYFGTSSGFLYAVQTRSYGYEEDAQWPSYGADNRNSSQQTLPPDAAFVTGTVTDAASGDAVAGARVILNPGGYSALTNSLGEYNLILPNPGIFTVEVSSAGMLRQQTDAVMVSEGDGNRFDFSLERDAVWIKWKKHVGEPWNQNTTIRTIAVDDDGTIYVQSKYSISALDSDGEILWKRETALDLLSSPSVADDGSVRFAEYNRIYSVTPDGNDIWWVNVSEMTTAAIGADGKAYFTSREESNMSIFAYDEDGNEVWCCPANNSYVAPAILRDGTIISGGDGRGLVAASPDGVSKWRYPLTAGTKSPLAVGPDNTIYLVQGLGSLYAFHPNGTIKYMYPGVQSRDVPDLSPIVSADNTAYFIDGSKNLYAVEQDGTLLWKTQDTYIKTVPVLSGDARLFLATKEGRLLIIDSGNGDTLYDELFGDSFSFAPKLLPDGTLYLFSDSGFLYSIQTDAFGYPDAPCWPCMYGDNRNTNRARESAAGPSLTGRIIDSDSGEGLANVLVKISPGDLTASSDSEGYYEFQWLAAGTYTLSAEIFSHNNFESSVSIMLSESRTFDITLDKGNVSLAWIYDATFNSEYIGHNSIDTDMTLGHDGTLYFANQDSLYALSPEREILWSRAIQAGRSGVSVDGSGRLYAGTEENMLYTLNHDGSTDWTFEIQSDFHGIPSLAENGKIYCGTQWREFYCLDSSGALLWEYHIDHSANTSSIAADETVYVGTNVGTLYAFNPDGTLKWKAVGGGNKGAAIGADGTVYACENYTVYAYAPDGQKLWSYRSDQQFSTSPVVDSDGTVYAIDGNCKCIAFAPDGTIKWEYQADGEWPSSPSIGSDGIIYFGEFGGTLYALDSMGNLAWQYDTGDGFIIGSPLISPEGLVMVAAYPGYIYAFQTKSFGLKADAPWPTFAQNNQRTSLLPAHLVSVEEDRDEIPPVSSLGINSPNPFNPVTSIPFSLGKESDVTIEVYNIAGEKITTLVDERLSAGNHSVTWNASDYASGVYFVRMEAGEFVEKRKMMLVK